MSYAVPHRSFSVVCSKNNVKLLMLALGISILGNNLGFASCDCDTTEPAWYMDSEPYCQIFPFYYKAEIDASARGYDAQYPPAWSSSGNCTEYWACLYYSEYTCPRLLSCKTSTYSDPNDEDNLPCSLFTNGACYGGMWLPLFGDCNAIELEGHWSGKTYTGSEGYDWAEDGDYYHYHSSTTMTAVFERTTECNSKPKPVASPYEATMHIRPMGPEECLPCDGYWSNEQTITISCDEAAHTIIEKTGDTMGLATVIYTKGCHDENGSKVHASSGTITISPNHDQIQLEDSCKDKSGSISYSVQFFDSAGNSLGSKPISVSLTTKPGKARYK